METPQPDPPANDAQPSESLPPQSQSPHQPQPLPDSAQRLPPGPAGPPGSPGWPAQSGPPGGAPWPQPPRPVFVAEPRLVVRSRADGRLVIAAIAIGVCFDIAAHSGIASIAATVAVIAAAAGLLLSGRVHGRTSTVLLLAAAVFGLTFTFRASPWVIVPAAFAVVLLLVLGASLGADGGGLAGTFPGLGTRIAVVAAHLINAPGMFYFKGESAQSTVARKWGIGVLRGAAIGVPIMLIVGLLLASADPIFRSWFDPSLVFQHLLLVVVGAWIIVGLDRAASAEVPLPKLSAAPSLGTVEVSIVLGGLCALYAAFVIAQFVALSGAGHRILVTHGLTYAQYARSGFFGLLTCAGITLLVLLGVRACVKTENPVIRSMSALTAALTLGVVVVAFRRLQLYEAAFGLTMLRLACFVVAVWIGVVFVLLAATILPKGLPRRRFPVALIVSGLLVIALWAACDPAAIVASTNLRRAEQGRPLDVGSVVSLGPDAVPPALADVAHLPPAERAALRLDICVEAREKDDGAAFNLARFDANALLRTCPAHSAGWATW
jgi:hypothetical protein